MTSVPGAMGYADTHAEHAAELQALTERLQASEAQAAQVGAMGGFAIDVSPAACVYCMLQSGLTSWHHLVCMRAGMC